MSLMDLTFTNSDSKKEALDRILEDIKNSGLEVIEYIDKPWGASIRINDNHLKQFLDIYFKDIKLPPLSGNLSPKFLIFAPDSRLSWQVHQRRGEYWRVIKGPMGMYLRDNDQHPPEDEFEAFNEEELISMPCGIRHQNAKMNYWTMVAEIWEHTEPQNPSDEADIRRIADDYNR